MTRRESPWLTSQEAVAYLKIGSLSALYRLVREHRLPYARLGGLYRFDYRDLDRFLHESTTAVASPLRSVR